MGKLAIKGVRRLRLLIKKSLVSALRRLCIKSIRIKTITIMSNYEEKVKALKAHHEELLSRKNETISGPSVVGNIRRTT